MKFKIKLFNSGKGKSCFDLVHGTRPWDIILFVSKGSFSLTFPGRGESRVFHPYEIAHVPPGTEFIRKVIEPIDFHQFNFKKLDDDAIWESMSGGMLHIPRSHVKAISENADILSTFQIEGEPVKQVLNQIVMEHYIRSKTLLDAESSLSNEMSLVIRYMNEEIDRKIDIDELAARVYLSHSGLIRKFKKEFGVSPSEYLINLRMRRAKQLLIENDITVGEAAEKCGYSNAYYFSNAFKKVTGMSPSEYKKKNITE